LPGLVFAIDGPCVPESGGPGAFHTPHAATGKAFTQP